MTSEPDNSSTDPDDPLGLLASPTPARLAFRAQQELVRQRLVAEFSSSPLYQARAARDPDYWKKFSVGGVR